jgi:hypothetical protein
VDAAGHIGELGEAALDTWLQAQQPPSAIQVAYQDRVSELRIGPFEACTWNRARHQDQSACPQTWSSLMMVSTSLEVPMGTLTRAD